jgi:complexin-1/2
MTMFIAKQMVGSKLGAVKGALGGGDKEEDGDKPETNEEGLDPEIAEARREAEEKRKEKHRKMEEEREEMRQGIRDKYGLKKKEEIKPEEDPDTAGRLGRKKKSPAELAAEAEAAEEEEDSILPPGMNDIKEKMTNLQGTVMTSVGEVTEKCVLQ